MSRAPKGTPGETFEAFEERIAATTDLHALERQRLRLQITLAGAEQRLRQQRAEGAAQWAAALAAGASDAEHAAGRAAYLARRAELHATLAARVLRRLVLTARITELRRERYTLRLTDAAAVANGQTDAEVPV